MGNPEKKNQVEGIEAIEAASSTPSFKSSMISRAMQIAAIVAMAGCETDGGNFKMPSLAVKPVSAEMAANNLSNIGVQLDRKGMNFIGKVKPFAEINLSVVGEDGTPLASEKPQILQADYNGVLPKAKFANAVPGDVVLITDWNGILYKHIIPEDNQNDIPEMPKFN
ncbi:hypothetical protein COU74_01295 [Candidatus Peregrinibacteria bacterium CG10_big_fil_rev_8_21_14_0_10_36_19]|nr:MAG: hypothetical protein COU74_01295 [Candidatus Peregrinibacteria bacterium CG10_big_fil_rev_8_21_14_0_10_36_19]